MDNIHDGVHTDIQGESYFALLLAMIQIVLLLLFHVMSCYVMSQYVMLYSDMHPLRHVRICYNTLY